MEIFVKTFDNLTKEELYEILQLRAEVFVIEQDCIYQDIDGKDQKALHVFGIKNNQITAYTRIFKPGDYFDKASIGRVLVKSTQRKYGFGELIMKASITAIHEKFREETIHISAQSYLKKFYNSLGFNQEGEEYLEDGIPHIAMIKK
ncbi:GNAT family N-acetyltransferase [Aurantibacter crassamenti]|uniref:GNAT family N-acetyltransferase n=1 Tax=Aurantibacter crassamenti TaxID=1837375 RepID=UPI00193970DB|nr:GNAT family N-acetyltransferase [Aurantibacter crassamenti]MBM1105215.1 GNAT family N-acetyltransferase [Aurantibacter crassamenti]